MNQDQQIRFNLVAMFKDRNDLSEEFLERMYAWVVGPKQTIVPVSTVVGMPPR